MKRFLPTPPAWFSIRNSLQEDTVDSLMKEYEDLDAFQRREFEKAKEEALPMMAEVVRDLDSTTEAMIRGGIRTWTPEAWKRVQENETWLKKLWKRLVLCISFPIGYAQHS